MRKFWDGTVPSIDALLVLAELSSAYIVQTFIVAEYVCMAKKSCLHCKNPSYFTFQTFCFFQAIRGGDLVRPEPRQPIPQQPHPDVQVTLPGKVQQGTNKYPSTELAAMNGSERLQTREMQRISLKIMTA